MRDSIIMLPDKLETSQLLRMPWTNSDNAFSWLEITHRCNLDCAYCYQKNRPHSDKPVQQVQEDFRNLLSVRKCDTVFISGGEPLVHPRLETIIQLVAEQHLKPVLVTNGHALTKERVLRLKQAGLAGFILHVDHGQNRPGWIGKSENELNALRQHYADMIHGAGGMICGFNTTILPETLHDVPRLVRWTVQNINKVCTHTLIPVRVVRADDPWDLYVRDQRIAFEDSAFASKQYTNPSGINLTARDIYTQVQNALPGFRANAFLGGTEIPDAPKWLFANIIGSDRKVFGYLGPKSMEILQNGYHLLKGRYLSFLSPSYYGKAKALLLLAIVDKQMRRTLRAYLAAAAKAPSTFFRKTSIQSLLILQPQDVLPSGKQDLCDGCPNKTIHEGRLVSMCRTEEYINFGDRVSLRRKPEETGKAVPKKSCRSNRHARKEEV